MQRTMKIIAMMFIIGSCDSSESPQNSNSTISKNPIQENSNESHVNHDETLHEDPIEDDILTKNIVYNTYDMPDNNKILDVCAMSSINDDSILLVKVLQKGEPNILDPCPEEEQEYHLPYSVDSLKILSVAAGDPLSGTLEVRRLFDISPNEYQEDDFLLAYVRKIDEIHYMARYYFAYAEEEAPPLNPSVVIDVPKNFEEFSRQLQHAQSQQNPDCPEQVRVSDERYKEFLSQPLESCAPALEDE